MAGKRQGRLLGLGGVPDLDVANRGARRQKPIVGADACFGEGGGEKGVGLEARGGGHQLIRPEDVHTSRGVRFDILAEYLLSRHVA